MAEVEFGYARVIGVEPPERAAGDRRPEWKRHNSSILDAFREGIITAPEAYTALVGVVIAYRHRVNRDDLTDLTEPGAVIAGTLDQEEVNRIWREAPLSTLDP